MVRVVIRAVLVPLALGLMVAYGGRLRTADIAEIGLFGLVALYVVGAFVLGIIGLGVWMWNLLDLMGVPAGSPVSCPRCGGTGTLSE